MTKAFSGKGLILALAAALALSGCGRDKGLNIEGAGDLPTDVKDLKKIDAPGLLRMAKHLEAAGDYPSALRFYEEAISRDTTLIEGHTGAGRMLTIAGATREATVHFGHAFDLKPDDPAIAVRYARGLLAQENPKEARTVLSRHLASAEGTPEVQNLLGIANDLLLDHTAAQSAYRRGLDMVSPGDQWKTVLLGNLALSLAIAGGYTEAILLLNPEVGDLTTGLQGLTETQSRYRQNLALVYALSGNPEAAFEMAKSALPEKDATFNRRFYQQVASLTGYDRVRAVMLGELPAPAGSTTQ